MRPFCWVTFLLCAAAEHCTLLPTLDSAVNHCNSSNIQVNTSPLLRSVWCYSLFAGCPSSLKWCSALQCQSLPFFNYLCKSICQVSLGKFCRPFTVQLSNFIWLLDLWVSYPRGREEQWLTASRGLILGSQLQWVHCFGQLMGCKQWDQKLRTGERHVLRERCVTCQDAHHLELLRWEKSPQPDLWFFSLVENNRSTSTAIMRCINKDISNIVL